MFTVEGGGEVVRPACVTHEDEARDARRALLFSRVSEPRST